VSFVVGFLAGTNRERNGQDQVMLGVDEIEASTVAHCTGNPQRPMADAAFAVADAAKAR
jgi:hypothetical protein